jgi:hypothetical protein
VSTLLARVPPAPSRTEWLVTAGACLYAVTLAYATTLWDYDIWGGLIVGPILVVVSLPLLRRVADRDGLSDLYPILVTALLVKLAMSIPRWAVAFALYDGTADANTYHGEGRTLAPIYRDLTFQFSDLPGGFGTKVMGSITGGVYAVMGPSVIGGFLVFSWIGFWGLLLCYRAARIAVPDLDAKRYAALLFFLPSMVFWPSSIGKEAIITLGIGLTAYGAARVFTHRRLGLVTVACGLTVSFLIRPHIAALLAGSFAIGYLVRPTLQRTALSPLVKVAGAVVISVAGIYVVATAAQSLGLDTATSATDELSRRGTLTQKGGSAFEASPISTPMDVPVAVLSVFFRPFPWEADSAQVLIAAAEGTAILGLAMVSWRRIGAGLRRIREPYILMSVIFLLGFLYAFSQFGNFGILARQRVQALPFLLLFLALARHVPRPSTVPTNPERQTGRN